MCVKHNEQDDSPLLPSELEAAEHLRKTQSNKKPVSEYSVRRGEVYFADLNPIVGSEQGGERPVLVVQNNIGNRYSPTVIVAPMTAQTGKANLPTHVEVKMPNRGARSHCIALMEQLRTIDKSRLRRRLGKASPDEMQAVKKALEISLALN